MTPDPRLCSGRRLPKKSSSRKKNWKNGSFANGEFRRRTTCSDEMFVTAWTARLATPVKSGVAGAPGGRGAARWRPRGRCCWGEPRVRPRGGGRGAALGAPRDGEHDAGEEAGRVPHRAGR